MQIFDDMPHVVVLFGSLCASAKYAYRSIARFIKSTVDLSTYELEEEESMSGSDVEEFERSKKSEVDARQQDTNQELDQDDQDQEHILQDAIDTVDNKTNNASDSQDGEPDAAASSTTAAESTQQANDTNNSSASSSKNSSGRMSTKFSADLQAPEMAHPKNIFRARWAYRKLVHSGKQQYKYAEEYISKMAYITAKPSTVS